MKGQVQNTKTARLHSLLDSLKANHSGLAYSLDKIKDSFVQIDRTLSFEALLQKLADDRHISITRDDDRILIRPYQPKNYTLHGMLKDRETGEHLIGAAVEITGASSGTITNGYGYFNLTLPEGDYTIRFSYLGYKSIELDIALYKNIYTRATLNTSLRKLDEIQVDALAANHNIESVVPSVHNIRLTGVENSIPYLLGEVDVIQNAFLHPGIRAIGEDASGIHVRGGNVDQNLILLDEAIIYNPNHFYGLISVFNPEAVNNVRIMKGYMPPSFGGRTSSVIEVRQKEGNNQETRISGGIGLLSARGLIEGPLKKGKSSYLFSARQSLLNLSIDDFGSSSNRRNRIRFQDVNLKINYKPSDKNTYYLSGYLGNDRNTVGFNSVRNWGNRMLNFRWNHVYTPKLFSTIAAFISEYNYRVENDTDPGAFISRSKIANYSVKLDNDYHLNQKNDFIFGFSVLAHRLIPGVREPLEPDDATNTLELDEEFGIESALYLGHETRIGSFSINYGLRYSMLHNLGASDVFQYQNNNPTADSAITDTLTFSVGELVKFYDNLEPRISVNWRLGRSSSVKASYSRTAQYIHLLSNTIAPAPTDIWKLSDTYIPPGTTDQVSLGYYKNLAGNIWQLSAEGYYKVLTDNIQYRNGADLVFNENIETELLYANGRSYGLELYAAKKKGKVQGWVSYTLSRAENTIDGQNILLNHDKTHDFSTSWNYKINSRLSISANFIANTGIPVTLPTDRYFFEGNLIPQFDERNNARLPTYHRLDLSVRLDGRARKRSGAARKNRDHWNFTVYNVYARKNAYSYFFRASEQNPEVGEVVKFSIFGTAIPAITYNFKF
ncbi:MAG: TonB-dependent receptor [Bacteroidota bacterium]